MSGAQEELRCAIPEGDHHRIQVGKGLQRGVEESCETLKKLGYF